MRLRAASIPFAYAAAIEVVSTTGAARLVPAPSGDRLAELLPAYNPIPAGASNVIVATDLLRTVGGFDPTFAHLADWDLWVRLAEAGRAVACDEPLVGYRLHPASMRSTAGGALAELARFDRVHGRGRRPPPERIWFYRWLADGQLLAGRRASAAGTTLRGALRCRSRADSIRAARIMLGRGGALPRGPDPAPDADWLRPLLPGPASRSSRSPRRSEVRSSCESSDREWTPSSGRCDYSSVPAGVALVYHGIHDQRSADGPTLDDVGAGTFSRQLEYVQSRFRLVPAGRLREAALGRRRGERFPLAVTLDDDLRSHVDVALPILRAASAPATFFLTGASLDGPSSFWWERVERALASEVGEELIGTRDPAEAVAIVADLPVERRNELADELLERLGGEEDGSGLRAAQVAEMTAAGCEVGFHTRDHQRLTTLDAPALERAMNVGIDELARSLGVRSADHRLPARRRRRTGGRGRPRRRIRSRLHDSRPRRPRRRRSFPHGSSLPERDVDRGLRVPDHPRDPAGGQWPLRDPPEAAHGRFVPCAPRP